MDDLFLRKLEAWRRNIQIPDSVEKIRGRKEMDYGDDIKHYEKKEAAEWALALQYNPYYKGHR